MAELEGCPGGHPACVLVLGCFGRRVTVTSSCPSSLWLLVPAPLELRSAAIPISRHLPGEGPWREIPAGHSWGVQLCFPAPLTLCLPRADCDLRDLQDMQEDEGDTSDAVGSELAGSQPAKPVSARLSPSQVCVGR